MFVWDRMGAIKTYEVVVRRDLSSLVEQVKNLFPGEPISVAGSGKDVVISGTVSSKYVIDKAADIAAGYVEKKENVVNLLKQAEGVASNQVMLKVRFAEVSRNALQELGASLFSNGKNDIFARSTTQQFAAPIFDDDDSKNRLVFSDYLNLFLFDAKNQIGAVVKALQGAGVFQSLAEPNLIALNGKEASFLAGGEFPYPIPQGGLGAVSIMFKEYGVRLNFTPTVLGGDLINLKIRPEVSSLDFNNAITIEGFRVPALVTRRAETEVELQDGQTFAIAGLMNNTALSSMRKVPGLGDIPVLGLLFRSRAYQKDQTELVVMITPTIVRRGSTGVSSGIPSLVEPFMPGNDKPIAPPAPYIGSPVYPVPGGGAAPSQAQPVQQQPAAAPAVQAPLPSTPIQEAATLPAAPAAAPKMTEKQRKALEAEEAKARKAAAAEEKRQAAAAKIAAEKAEQDRKKAEKLEQERAKAQAEADRKAAAEAEKAARRKLEDDRNKAAENEKRDKELTEAAARLKDAQAAYQAQISKTTKGGGK
jgi:pilus assembly protein CpaC